MQEAPLGALSPNAFLQAHWQKRPLLVRGALPRFRGVISRRGLFALAARDDVDARLVERTANRWRVTPGPIARTPPRRGPWTLLVHGVDRHRVAAERLLRRFAFVPLARLDDVMVSYATPGGGVGPHFDSYDVFLVQGRGRRVWRLARPRAFRLVAGAPLKLIENFRAEEELLLEPGDLLYLPPGWGHDGVALEAGFTCSVGCRAPGGAELAAAFLDYLHERGLPDATYRDPELRAGARPARVPAGLVDFTARHLARIRWGRADVEALLGRHLTQPAPSVVFRPRRAPRNPAGNSDAVLDPKTRMLYLGRRFFLNGEPVPARTGQHDALAALADRRRADARRLVRAGLGPLIEEWRAAGYLHLEARP